MTHPRQALFLLFALFPACSTDHSPEKMAERGRVAFAHGDYEVALEELDAALQGTDPSADGYVALAVDRLAALCYAGEDTDPVTELTALAAAHPDEVQVGEFAYVVQQLALASRLSEADRLLDHGLQSFPQEERLQALQSKIQDMQAREAKRAELEASQPQSAEMREALDRLKSGGYSGSAIDD